MGQLYRILSIDGGGIRGIIPARVLIALEKKIREASGRSDACISDYFDFIAGTSTGGILTCVFLTPGAEDPERPRFCASQALELYYERGREIFDASVWHRVRSAWGLLDERYPAEGLENVLDTYLSDLKLSDLLKPSLITAYDLERRRTHFFTQHRAQGDAHRNFRLRDVARATSAAPTYFECARIRSDADETYTLVDGGVFASNPALCAYAEVRRFVGKTAVQMAILSLGTGTHERVYPYEDAKGWGLAEWTKPIVNVMMSAVGETVDFQLRQIFDAVNAPSQYLRIDTRLPEKNADLDNVDVDNMQELDAAGTAAVVDNEDRLDTFVDLLVSQAR